LIRGEIKARRRRPERYKRTWVGGISAITGARRLGVYRLRLGWIYRVLPVGIVVAAVAYQFKGSQDAMRQPSFYSSNIPIIP